jgi:cysteine synthase
MPHDAANQKNQTEHTDMIALKKEIVERLTLTIEGETHDINKLAESFENFKYEPPAFDEITWVDHDRAVNMREALVAELESVFGVDMADKLAVYLVECHVFQLMQRA